MARHADGTDAFDDTPRLDVIPDIVVSSSLRNRKRWMVMAAAATLVIHASFAAFFILFVNFRDLPNPPERAIPIEVVTSIPEGPKALHPGGSAAGAQAPPPVTPAAAPPSSDKPAPPPLVAPPPETMKAQAQPVEDKPATLSTEETPKQDRPPPSPPAPAVLSAPTGSFSVQDAAPPSPAASSSAKEKEAVAAKLAQALPMDVSALPSTFRAVLSAQGNEVNAEYKGIVFARLQRAHQAMEEARRRKLHGRVIVSFSVDEAGRAVDLKIAGSSGMPEVDDLAIAMVREAEPFPPPPPGIKPVFTPGLIVGDEDE